MNTHLTTHKPSELVQIDLSTSSQSDAVFTYYNGRRVRIIKKGAVKIPALLTTIQRLSHEGTILARLRKLAQQ